MVNDLKEQLEDSELLLKLTEKINELQAKLAAANNILEKAEFKHKRAKANAATYKRIAGKKQVRYEEELRLKESAKQLPEAEKALNEAEKAYRKVKVELNKQVAAYNSLFMDNAKEIVLAKRNELDRYKEQQLEGRRMEVQGKRNADRVSKELNKLFDDYKKLPNSKKITIQEFVRGDF